MGDNTKYTGLLVSQSLAKLGSGDRLSMLERPPRRLGVSRFDVMSKLTSASRLPRCTSVLRALSPMCRICNFCRPEKDEGSSSLILLWFKYSCSRFLSPSNPSTCTYRGKRLSSSFSPSSPWPALKNIRHFKSEKRVIRFFYLNLGTYPADFVVMKRQTLEFGGERKLQGDDAADGVATHLQNLQFDSSHLCGSFVFAC